MKKNGSVSIGNVVVSSGGSLSCKHIVHTVGPRWQGGTNKEPELLQSVLEKCLVESDQRQCTSVAIPALCTGVYKYPIDQACLLIVTTIKQYFQVSVAHQVCVRSGYQKQGRSKIRLKLCLSLISVSSLNSLPYNRFLDLSKLITFADEK